MKIKLLKLLKEYLNAASVTIVCIIAIGMFYCGYIVLSVALRVPKDLLLLAILIIPALCVAVKRLLKRIKGDSEVE